MSTLAIKVSEIEKPLILKYIKSLLQQMNVANSGQVSWSGSVQFDMMVEVIISKVYGQGVTYRKNLSRRYVLNAIVELKKKGNEDPKWEDFEQEIRKMVTGYLASSKLDFKVLFPLHVNQVEVKNRRIFKVLKIKFKKTNWKQIRLMKGWNQYLESLYIPSSSRDLWVADKLGRLFVPITVTVQGRTYIEAFEEASRYFELFRGIVNFAYNFGRSRIIIAGAPKPLGLCLPPPVYVIFKGDGSFENIYYTSESYTYGESEVTNHIVRAADKIIHDISRVPSKIRDIVIEAILLYGQAMDTADWRTAFLGLWQILEGLSLQSASNLNMAEVARRTSFLIGNKNIEQLLNDFVGAMAEARNLLVHKGKFSEDGQDEVNLLKMVAERSILAFLDKSRKFSTRELLEEFYINSGLPSKRLHSRQKAIKAILNE